MTELRATLRAKKSATKREAWVDVAKGATILLVVLHHSVQHLGAVGIEMPLLTAGNDALKTFRMPLFFFASGLFFAGNLRKSLPALMRSKIGPLLYLTALWSVIQGVFFWATQWKAPEFGWLTDIALAFAWPTTVMWYVYALALYGMAVWVLAKLPFWAQCCIVLAVSGSFASGLLATPSWAWDSILSNFIFFFTAMRFRAVVFSVAALPLRWVIVPAAAWVALVGAAFVLNLGIVSPLRVPASLAGIAAAVIVARAVARTPLGSPLSWLGSHTMPIFALHLFVVYGAAHYLAPFNSSGAFVEGGLVVGVAASAATLSLLAWLVLRHIPGLFVAPWSKAPAHSAQSVPAPIS